MIKKHMQNFEKEKENFNMEAFEMEQQGMIG